MDEVRNKREQKSLLDRIKAKRHELNVSRGAYGTLSKQWYSFNDWASTQPEYIPWAYENGLRGQDLKARKNMGVEFSKDWDGGTTEYCLKMKHPSLDQEYIEWVHPDIGKQKDADLAQATAFGWTVDQYLDAAEA